MSETVNASVYTVDEFCIAHKISRGHFYNLVGSGNGPTLMKVGRRTLISAEAAARWRSRMESAASATRDRHTEIPNR